MQSVSIIIPVYNDRERLMRCLEALRVQTYAKERYEVIVVDNGSTRIPADFADRFENVRLAVEPGGGSYAARNRGLAIANGSLLAFTDADCLPDPNWLEEGVACFTRTPSCGLVAGEVQLKARKPGRPTACERYDQLFYLDQERAVRKGHYGATANLFTSKDVMRSVGTFDATLMSAGDNEWGQRVYRRGFQQVYCPTAVVRHPARRSLRTLVRKERRVAGGLIRVEGTPRRAEKHEQTARFSERLQQLFQPLRNALGVVVGRTSRQIPSVSQRIQVAGIVLLVHGLRRLEAWRVAWGGTPKNT